MREALSSLRARPRPFLACVGMVVIAVCAMTVIPTLTKAASAKVLADLNSLGSNAFIVTPRGNAGAAHLPPGSLARASDLPGNEGALHVVQTTIDARLSIEDPVNHGVGVLGVDATPAHAAVEATVGAYRPVPGYAFGVLGTEAAQALGVTNFPVTIVAGGVPVCVTGIVNGDPLIPSMAASLITDTATAIAIDPTNFTDSLVVRVTGPAGEQRVAAAVDPTTSVPLDVTQPEALVAAKSQSTTTLDGLGLLAAGVAFLVAAFGIAIMLTSAVRQRTAEIAVRRVHGASTPAVFQLILSEGCILGAVGAALGLAAANISIVWVVRANDWPPVDSGGLQIVSGLVALIVCLVAAVPPTLVAVRIQPSRAFAVE